MKMSLRASSLVLPVIVLAVTILITAPLILLAHANPIDAYYAFFIEPFNSRITAIEVLVKTAPFLLTGVAVAVAFSAGYYNIGAEGQVYAGAIFAAWLGPLLKDVPPALALPLMIVGGMLAGAVWALIPALLKTRANVDEVISTLLSNSIMGFLVSGLLNGPWRNPITKMPQSPGISPTAEFPMLLANSRLHLGFILALVVVIGYGWVMHQTPLGLRFRAVGLGRASARFLGIDVARTTIIAALLSGAIAGLAGVGEVAGVHHRLIEESASGLGIAGVIVATLGGLSAWGVALAALFIGLIENGAQEVARSLGVPIYLANVVQATLLIVTLVVLVFQRKAGGQA